jgi:hypothetical protein
MAYGDGMGRIIEEISGMTGDIKDVLRDALAGGTKKETKVQDESVKSDEERNKLLDEIVDLLESMDSNFSKQMKADKSRVTGKGKVDVEVLIDGDKPKKAGGIDGEEYGKEFEKTSSKFANAVTRAAGMLGGGKALGISTLFKGAFKEQIQFRIGMKEIQFQTKGITKAAQGAIDPWTDLGDVTQRTGMFLMDFQAGYMKALKGGVKSQKETVKVLKAAGNLSFMIGSDAAQTSDLFHKWHMTLGLSGNQMAQINRDTRMIAIETGVTGDNLLEAMKASEKYMMNMRNASTLTVEGTKNVIKLVAEAKKLGIEEETGKFLDAASGSAKFFFETSSETQTLMSLVAQSAGKYKELTEGTLVNTRSNLAAMAGGFDEVFKSFSRGVSLDNLDLIDPAELQMINMQLHGIGTSAEKMRLQMVNLDKGAMSLGDNLTRISKELENQNLTVAERTLLEKEQNDLLLGTSMGLVSSFQEGLKDVGKDGLGLTEALEKSYNKLNKDQKEDLATIGEKFNLDMSKPINKLGAVQMQTAEALKEAGGKDFTGAIKDALASGDSTQIRQLNEEMSAEMEKQGKKEAAGVDYLKEMAEWMKELNEKFVKFTFVFLGGLLGAMATTLVLILAELTAIAMSFGGGFIGKMLGKSKLGGKLLGKVGLGGGGGAAKTALSSTKSVFKSKGGLTLDDLAPKVAPKGVIKGTGGGMLRRMSQMDGVLGKVGKNARVAKIGISKLAGKAGLGALVKTAGVAVKGIPVVGWVIAGLMAGFEGLEQGAKSAAAANEIFAVSQEKVTGSMKTAAENAGTITGTIDSLTFGLAGWLLGLLGLGDVLGPTGSLTKGIAQFFDKFQFLSKLFTVSLIPIKLLWAVLKGLWGFVKNIFIGLWEAIKIAMEPFAEIFTMVGDALSEVFGGGSGDEFASGMETVEYALTTLASTLSMLGTGVGWVLKAIGFFIKAALTPLVAYFKIIGKVLKAIFGKGDFETLWEDVLEILYEQFVNLWGSIFGKEAVEKAVGSFKGAFAKLWNWLYDGVAGAFEKAWNFLYDLIPDWVIKAAKGAADVVETAAGKKETLGRDFKNAGTNFMDILKYKTGWESKEDIIARRKKSGIDNFKRTNVTGTPFFAQGTRRIGNDGLAMLHKDEMVIPALQAGMLRGAEGDEPGSFFDSMMQSNPIIASLSRFAGLDPETEVKKHKVTKNSKTQTSEDPSGEERAKIQREIRDLMARLVDLQQKESVASAGLSEQQKEQSTRTNTKPLGPRRFGELSSNKYLQAAHKMNFSGIT